MSEAELHIIHARLRGGVLNKVMRGEYRSSLPTGLVYNEVGDVVLDPDSQVQKTITYFFDTFSRVGSACQTVKAFRAQGLNFPSRMRNSNNVVFRALTTSSAIRTLKNPRYAGTYAYGIRHYRRTVDGVKVHRKSNFKDWTACIPGAHPGYITWEQYQANLKLLASNGKGFEAARKSPPREGSALLQGRAICGRCGGLFRVRYRSCRGKNESWYVCDAVFKAGERNCQSIAGPPVDTVVGDLIIEQMTPSAIEMAIDIRKEIDTRQAEVDQLKCKALERAQIEADLAQRRYMMVDPSNRLVADTLEAAWNQKLYAVEQSRLECDRYRDENPPINQAVCDRLSTLTTDFRKIWTDSLTPNRERKRLLSHIIEDVTLLKSMSDGVITIHVRFKGGRTDTLHALTPQLSYKQIKTSDEIVALVDKLLDDYIYSEISEILNERGFRPGFSTRRGRQTDRFTTLKVRYLAAAYHLRSRHDRLRDRGYLTCYELAQRLGVHEATVQNWVKLGKVVRHAYDGHSWLYEEPYSLKNRGS